MELQQNDNAYSPGRFGILLWASSLVVNIISKTPWATMISIGVSCIAGLYYLMHIIEKTRAWYNNYLIRKNNKK